MSGGTDLIQPQETLPLNSPSPIKAEDDDVITSALPVPANDPTPDSKVEEKLRRTRRPRTKAVVACVDPVEKIIDSFCFQSWKSVEDLEAWVLSRRPDDPTLPEVPGQAEQIRPPKKPKRTYKRRSKEELMAKNHSVDAVIDAVVRNAEAQVPKAADVIKAEPSGEPAAPSDNNAQEPLVIDGEGPPAKAAKVEEGTVAIAAAPEPAPAPIQPPGPAVGTVPPASKTTATVFPNSHINFQLLSPDENSSEHAHVIKRIDNIHSHVDYRKQNVPNPVSAIKFPGTTSAESVLSSVSACSTAASTSATVPNFYLRQDIHHHEHKHTHNYHPALYLSNTAAGQAQTAPLPNPGLSPALNPLTLNNVPSTSTAPSSLPPGPSALATATALGGQRFEPKPPVPSKPPLPQMNGHDERLPQSIPPVVKAQPEKRKGHWCALHGRIAHWIYRKQREEQASALSSLQKSKSQVPTSGHATPSSSSRVDSKPPEQRKDGLMLRQAPLGQATPSTAHRAPTTSAQTTVSSHDRTPSNALPQGTIPSLASYLPSSLQGAQLDPLSANFLQQLLAAQGNTAMLQSQTDPRLAALLMNSQAQQRTYGHAATADWSALLSQYPAFLQLQQNPMSRLLTNSSLSVQSPARTPVGLAATAGRPDLIGQWSANHSAGTSSTSGQLGSFAAGLAQLPASQLNNQLNMANLSYLMNPTALAAAALGNAGLPNQVQSAAALANQNAAALANQNAAFKFSNSQADFLANLERLSSQQKSNSSLYPQR